MQCNTLVQSIDQLPENGFQSVNADFVQNFLDSRKKFICRPELLSLEVAFEMPKQNKKKSEGVKSCKYSEYGGYEMQRIDKPTIYNGFWNIYPVDYLSSRRKGSPDL
jgi:hypothetical protein